MVKPRNWKEIDETIRSYLGLKYSLVGVKLLKEDAHGTEALKPERPMEYCKTLRLASMENRVFLYGKDDEACSTAHFVLGFREPKLSGVEPRVKPADTKGIQVAPLSRMEEEPDVVHAILTPRQMMELTSILKGAGVESLAADFKGEKACSDFTAKPYLDRKPNVSFLCKGARLLADFREDEVIFGAPPEVYVQAAEAISEVMKSGGPLCGCRASDLPKDLVQELEKIGLSKGTDYFLGKFDGTNVRVYLNKDLRGRFKLLTIRIPLKMASEEKAKEAVERLSETIRPYEVVQRGPWIDFILTASEDELGVDLYSGENLERLLKSIVGDVRRHLQKIGHEG
ncbi:DUF169 domain-containing protein [Candidatus Hecatella orcuttiae]|jgi:uncharacterized protein (DUF169 family)|uniref:DUF169 domain-containing protein n=1 Tax=Candidatus Hecatella orcuttiae TaxID=1935119 RepID=UPI002867D98F|nr:DUF169 domain-containing protein [Candidatus Hecatella orcuttiae]